MDIHTLMPRFGRLLFIGLVFSGVSASATDYFVAPWGDDGKDGLSWETAMKSPELVPERWSDHYNTITISNGTYKLSKQIRSEWGGTKIRSLTGKPDDVVLDGQGQCGGIRIWNTWDGEVAGLTVTNCVVTDENGAGIATRDTYCKIVDCIVRDCHVNLKNAVGYVSGAGIHVMWGVVSGCTIEDCSFRSVEGAPGLSGRGGGIYGYRSMVTNCVVRRCAMRLNDGECYPSGGGVYLEDGGEEPETNVPLPSIVDSQILDCGMSLAFPSGGAGSGLCISSASPDGETGELRQAIVRNCVISGCTNWYQGPLVANHADIIDTTVTNCVSSYPFANDQRGTGLWLKNRCRVRGCLITGNVGTPSDTIACGTPPVYMGDGCSIVDSAVVGNSSGAHSALRLGSNGLVSNCLFRANSHTGSGGVGLIYVPDLLAGSLTEITDCYFVDNDLSKSSWGGWAFFDNSSTRSYEVRFRNCLYANNLTGESGILVFSHDAAQNASRLNVNVENCTIAYNVEHYAWNYMIQGYYEGLDEEDHATAVAPYRISVRGCLLAGNSVGRDIERQTYSISNLVNYSLFSPNDIYQKFHPNSVGNVAYEAGKPLFIDADAKDYRMAQGSQALDMVPPSAWMGTGRKNGPQDLGSGCEMVAVEDYGVTIKRLNASPRLCGDRADAGCCEYYLPPGMMLLLR